MQLTIINTKNKHINSEYTSVIDTNVYLKHLSTRNVTEYPLENGSVLVIPNYNHSSTVGFAHSLFDKKIVYNTALIYHPKNRNFIEAFNNIRWVDDILIKHKETIRLEQLRKLEASI